MPQRTSAIYENGRFTPLKPVEGLPEHSVVELVIEDTVPASTEEQLAILRSIPGSPELADVIEAGRNQEWTTPEY